jgi:hypothetical protein
MFEIKEYNVNDRKMAIEQICSIQNELNCGVIDAVIYYCDESDIDIDDFSAEMKKDKHFIELIKTDGMYRNLLRKSDGFVPRASLDNFF